ncbi:hypothetical protein [Flammeovirga pacifica]|uniref:DUF4625 domain-containing protein n=1 Tax=Flammeovirga pacifica TaxID=915059 RepID=A0A1S1YSK7_FLAPC|nr:hypothetical protein [Flammeovirga pacifica]OHX63998.1 hypothetical protein NH26_20525 [Flammeovirga pacifica]
MIKNIHQLFLYSLLVFFLFNCQTEENVSKDIMQIESLTSEIVSFSETDQFLEVIAKVDYVDMSYLRVDIHSMNQNISSWDVTHIYNDLDNYTFHGQFSIPEGAYGEYEIIIYLSDKENNIISKNIPVFIEP